MIDEMEQRGCTRIHLRVAGLGLKEMGVVNF